MRTSLLTATAVLTLAALVPANAQICPPPLVLMPPCCPSPCPVVDLGSLGEVLSTLETAKQYTDTAKQYASEAMVLKGALQHGVPLPNLASVLPVAMRIPALASAGATLDGFWQVTTQDVSAVKSIKKKFAATGRDAALSAFGSALYLPTSLNSELSPAIGQSLNLLTTASNFADGHSATSYTRMLPLLGSAQAGTPLSALIALKASHVAPSGNYSSTVGLGVAAIKPPAAPSTVAPVATQQQRLAQLVQSLSTIVAFNNARVSAAALAESAHSGAANTSQATAQLDTASKGVGTVAASMFSNGPSAAKAIELFLTSHDPTTYTDNFSKAPAAQAAADALSQQLQANPSQFGTLKSSASISGAEFSAAALAYLDAYKTAQYAIEIAQAIQASQQQSAQMLTALNGAWKVNLLSPAAAQQQVTMANALLVKFNANADLSSVAGYSHYMEIVRAAATNATTPALLTF